MLSYGLKTVKCGKCAAELRRPLKFAIRTCFCDRSCWLASEQRKARPGWAKDKKHSPSHVANRAASLRGKKRTGQALENIRRANSDPKNHRYGSLHHNWKPGAAERKAIKKACHGFIWNAIRMMPNHNNDEVIEALGWSPRQLQEHLERQFTEGMTWANHARTGWHIDHIRPICSFPEGTPLSVINALDNLRPLWYAENIRKGGKYVIS